MGMRFFVYSKEMLEGSGRRVLISCLIRVVHTIVLWASLQDSAVVGRIRGKGRSAIIDFVERMTTLHQNAQQNAFDHFEAWHVVRTLQILDEQKLEARDEQERQRRKCRSPSH